MPDSDSTLADLPFSYIEAKSGKVLISHHSKQVTVLQGKAASKFVAAIASLSVLDAQRHMAAATGQYKFGNERSPKLARERGLR